MALMIRAVLAEPATVGVCLQGAATAAAIDPAARIEALHVRVDPESLILPTEEIMTAMRRSELEHMISERSRMLRLAFEAWLASPGAVGASAQWREVTGTVAAVIASRGFSVDLLVLASPHSRESRDALHASIFAARALLLLVPPSGAAAVFRHVAIAWKDSDQARRAVAAAAPWLKRAQRVSVLAVDEEHGDASSPAVLPMLADLGIAAEVLALRTGAESVAELLLASARSVEADCLVMGAYRHNRLVEGLLGGVTKHMLNHADIPVFMRH